MRLQVPILKTFEFGRPQWYAGLMLLGVAALALTAAYVKPVSSQKPEELNNILRARRSAQGPNDAVRVVPNADELLMH